MTDAEIQALAEIYSEEFLAAERAKGEIVIDPATALTGTDWALHFFPQLFSRPFTAYQKEFWEWAESIQANTYHRPRIECQPRGVGKSTNAEAAVAKWVADGKRRMVGYVSLNDTKATKHFDSIKSMLESPAYLAAYPHCKPGVQKLRDVAAQWSRDALVTESGAMIVPLSLQGSSRGWKSSTGSRFDVIVLDDIDELGQSPDVTTKMIEILKGEILAAGDANTLVLMPQNLIYRDSICSQVLDHRADILSDRIFCGPFPLLKWYDAQKIDMDDGTGARQWMITAGEVFDEAISMDYAQALLNKFGKALFDRECQQLVHVVENDKDFREWDERYHLITYSEFRDVMENLGEQVWNDGRQCLQIPTRWNVGLGFDWGTTVKHPSAVACVARPSMMSPLHDCHFVFTEVVKPQFPLDAFETPELVSPGRVAEAVQNALHEWNVIDSQIQMKLMSHEASAALSTMAVDLKPEVQMYWSKWIAQRGSGVPQIQNLLEIDRTKPHPFRRFPEPHNEAGRPLPGRPRLYFLVPDEQGRLWSDGAGLYVLGAKDAAGFARARFEIPLYSHRHTLSKKIDDDWVDAFRGLMNIFGAKPDSLTREEVIEEKLSKQGLAWNEIIKVEDEKRKLAMLQRRMIEQRALAQPKTGTRYPRVAVRRGR